MKKTLLIHPSDSVAVALVDLKSGETADSTVLVSDIPRGHKIAVRDIVQGEIVLKYGLPIGTATKNISVGEHVHVHNLSTQLSGPTEYAFKPIFAQTDSFPKSLSGTFRGFPRSDGTAGIRNDLWIVPTVGCVNRLTRNLADEMNRRLPFGTVSKTIALEHPLGCSQLGDDHERTANLLASLARHPNAGGVLVVSLGCENNTMNSFRKRLGSINESRFRFMIAQDVGDEFEQGISLLTELLETVSRDRREDVPISELKIGLKCGGSDAFSGITANPLVGLVADRIVAVGGTCVLTEVPEMFGAEEILLNRSVNPSVFDKGVRMINDFKGYFQRYGQPVYENPSPGNKEGGISTLEEKSIGCTQKSGSTPVADVLDYGCTISRSGLNLLTGPGNDMVACTLLAAAGCQLILFTTGRGTPLGTVVPTLKISSNTELSHGKPHWIDFDAGKILSGITLSDAATELAQLVFTTASGNYATLNERNRFQEIALFKDGVTL